VAKLASGLYEPWEGEVLFEGVDRRKIPRQLLASSVALVDQEISLFEGTIKIIFLSGIVPCQKGTLSVRVKTPASMMMWCQDRVPMRAALKRTGGTSAAGSDNAWKLARALSGNPTILILDEATSALDSVTEKQIDDNLRRRGCTCLIVAHRLSTIRDCDEIIVLDRGEVVQRGTHEELITVDGPYRDLMAAEN